jgi:peptidoglycan/xylan/chitin deacetylase (PgdA/CDA1 family)
MSGPSSLKRIIKTGVKEASGIAGILIRTPMPHGRILTYHSVGSRAHEMNVLPDAFHAQMRWLADRCEVLPLETVVRESRGLAITLDDGYLDNVRNALPILKECGLPATVFLATGRMGGFLDHDIPCGDACVMTWEDARRWIDAGLSVGAHTRSHPRLSRLAPDEQRAEICGSRDDIEANLGLAPDTFAYPFGSAADYDVNSVEIARSAGFRLAVSNRYGVNGPDADPFTLRRIWIDASDDMRMFRAKATGRLDLLACLESPLALALRRRLNRQ